MAQYCKACGVKVRNRYYCPEHSPLKDPAWRSQRGRRGGQAMHEQHEARLRKTFARMTPTQAGAYGYRVGYKRAYHWWKRRVTKILSGAA